VSTFPQAHLICEDGKYLGWISLFIPTSISYFLPKSNPSVILIPMAIDAEIKIDFGSNPELEELFRAGAHFAYSRSHRHPNMAPFIYGIKNNAEVFDLERVLEKLREASGFMKKLGEAKKSVLWVGTKPSAARFIEEAASETRSPYVSIRWLGGTLTNAKIIRERIKYFEDLKNKKESGELGKYTKKEELLILREIRALGKYLSGLTLLKNDLGAAVIVDPGEEQTAFREALKVKLPVVAILSSDNDPAKVDWPVPANDISPSSVGYILKKLSHAYVEGLQGQNSGVEE